MIKKGLDLFETRFVKKVGGSVDTNGCSEPQQKRFKPTEELSCIEIFYASTANNSARRKSDSMMTFLVDKRKVNEITDRDMVNFEMMRDMETEEANKKRCREQIDSHIACTLISDQTKHLQGFLERHMREKATIERMKRTNDKKDNNEEKNVCYITSSFLVDCIHPMLDGMNKRSLIDKLKKEHFEKVEPTEDMVKWSHSDADLPLLSAVFGPVVENAIYENNLQSLLLPPAFRLRETQKLDAKGPLIAFMALFAPDHSHLVEVFIGQPTTLRGLFSNLLDGTIYEGYSISTLQRPLKVIEQYQGDLMIFCNNVLKYSYYSVFLTFLKIKAWRSDRYPENRFVTNDNTLIAQQCVMGEGENSDFTTIILPEGEVIYDVKDDYWIYQRKGNFLWCPDFNTLLKHLYDNK